VPRKKDTHARLRRLRKIRDGGGEATDDSAKVLKGMQQVAKDKAKGLTPRADDKGAGEQPVKAKRWDEALERPNLDYSEIFDEDVGQVPNPVISLFTSPNNCHFDYNSVLME